MLDLSSTVGRWSAPKRVRCERLKLTRLEHHHLIVTLGRLVALSEFVDLKVGRRAEKCAFSTLVVLGDENVAVVELKVSL